MGPQQAAMAGRGSAATSAALLTNMCDEGARVQRRGAVSVEVGRTGELTPLETIGRASTMLPLRPFLCEREGSTRGELWRCSAHA